MCGGKYEAVRSLGGGVVDESCFCHFVGSFLNFRSSGWIQIRGQTSFGIHSLSLPINGSLETEFRCQ